MLPVTIVSLILLFVSVHADDIIVSTKAGTFEGFSEEVDNGGELFEVSKFLGIPYAEPPVGDLRFRKPVPKKAIPGTMEVKKFGSTCMQAMLLPYPTKGSEDCLFLNVYSPKVIKPGVKLPVMIWIHGGGFVFGSANAYIPDRLVANGPVIVVTINYRLSIWGFLTTGDSNSPGNYGLWDQHLAIIWVDDNIDAFGGDPKRITIFGESAGSASVVYQGLYKGNIGLFQRIIAQSGSPSAVWGTSRSPLADAKDFASIAGCETSNIEAMMACLRALPNDVINGTLNNITNGLVTRTTIFVPYVDNDFIEEPAVHIFNQDTEVAESSRSTFATFDLMIGTTSGEGYLLVPPWPWDTEAQNNFCYNRTFFRDTLVPQLLYDFWDEVPPAVVEAVVAEYTDWNDPDNFEIIRDKYVTLAGDVFFVEPMCRTIDLHAKYSQRQSSYMYYFTLKPSKHGFPTVSWADKPNHGDDIIFVFGGKSNLSEFGVTETRELEEWENEASMNIMTLWTNFATTGNPNKPRDLGLDWLPYTQKHRHYFDIAKTMTSRNVKTRLDDRIVNFWGKIVPALFSECKSQAPSETQGTCSKGNDCTL